MRAAISLRTDDTECDQTDGVNEPSFDSAWVGIDNNAGTKISQIGYIGVYDASLGGEKYCKFLAYSTGTTLTYVEYDSCNDSNNDNTLFQVSEGYDFIPQKVYLLYDCGSSGWGTCTLKAYGDPEYPNAYAYVANETDYGGSACTVKIMGSSSNHQNNGSTTYALQEQASFLGTWSTHGLTSPSPTCGHYQSNPSDTKMGVWDDRN